MDMLTKLNHTQISTKLRMDGRRLGFLRSQPLPRRMFHRKER